MDKMATTPEAEEREEWLRERRRWWAQEQKEKELRDYVDFAYDAECRGEARGEARGEVRGEIKTLQAVVKNMREKGFSLEDIGMYINKDADEVKALLKDV